MSAPPQPRRTGKKWLLAVAIIAGAMFSFLGFLAVLGVIVGAQGPTESEQKFVSYLRESWPVNAQPYTDAQLIKAGDRVCRFQDWDVEVHGREADVNGMLAKMRDIDHINDYTLLHAIVGGARMRGGLCS
jgi:hypothetical protein